MFRKIAYKVEDYALILPVSNDLLRDTDEALLAYISRWLAKKQVITEITCWLQSSPRSTPAPQPRPRRTL